jgi:hypothetical protein
MRLKKERLWWARFAVEWLAPVTLLGWTLGSLASLFYMSIDPRAPLTPELQRAWEAVFRVVQSQAFPSLLWTTEVLLLAAWILGGHKSGSAGSEFRRALPFLAWIFQKLLGVVITAVLILVPALIVWPNLPGISVPALAALGICILLIASGSYYVGQSPKPDHLVIYSLQVQDGTDPNHLCRRAAEVLSHRNQVGKPLLQDAKDGGAVILVPLYSKSDDCRLDAASPLSLLLDALEREWRAAGHLVTRAG